MAGRKPEGRVRLDGIDTARGVAIALMFLSHTVKALLPFRMMPDFGIVPIHLITKFSSSLFILVFGCTVGLVYLPKIGTEAWSSTRWQLIRRAIIVMFWYKLLTVAQLLHRVPPQAIMDCLIWKRFPDFVEILQFYGWFLLLLPWLLQLWRFLPLWGRALMAYAIGLAGYLLHVHFDFWGIWQLQAVLVEHPKAFCFGVITRGTMVFCGLLLTEVFWRGRDRTKRLKDMAWLCIGLGMVCLAVFVLTFRDVLYPTFVGLARNYGKHPPNFPFVTFTFGGSLTILGLCLLARGPLAKLLWPFTAIGRESLFCFNFHILLIFVGYRQFLDLRHKVTYAQALWLTLLLFVLAIGTSMIHTRIKRRLREHEQRMARPVSHKQSVRPDLVALAHESQWRRDTLPDVASGSAVGGDADRSPV